MRARTLIFLFLAVGTAALAATFVRSWMHAQQAASNKVEPTETVVATEVLVAKHAIPAGMFIKAEDLRWQVWPDGALAEGYVTKANGSLDAFTGAVVKIGFSTGEPLTESRVAKPGDRGFFAAVLAPGNRAVALAVNPVTGVSGFVLPGDRVDVLLTHAFEEKGAERSITATETVLQDIRVIAIDQSPNDNVTEAVLAKTVTLEATPKEAEKLNLVAQMGKVSLALRSLAIVDAPPPPVPARPTLTVDTEVSPILSGSKRQAMVQVVRGRRTQMENGGPAGGAAGRPTDSTPADVEDQKPVDAPVAAAPASANTAVAGQLP